MMLRLTALLMAMLLAVPALASLPTEELADAELATMTGREGIALDLELRLNADTNGVPLASLSSCTGNLNPCRLGLEFQGRAGKWLMMKDFYGVLKINELLLNGAYTPAAGPAVYFDPLRFASTPAGGDCLVTGGGVPCVASNLWNLPAASFSFPTAGKPATFYNDASLFLNIGRVAAEFNDPFPAGTTTLGYNRDAATGTVLGLRIQDTAGGSAGMRLDGRMLLYGF